MDKKSVRVEILLGKMYENDDAISYESPKITEWFTPLGKTPESSLSIGRWVKIRRSKRSDTAGVILGTGDSLSCLI